MDSSPLIAGLELLFRRYNITTVDELAMLLRQDGNGVADYITSSDNRQAAYKRWSSWQQSQPSANNASTAQASVQATTAFPAPPKLSNSRWGAPMPFYGQKGLPVRSNRRDGS